MTATLHADRASTELAAALRPAILRLARRLRQMSDPTIELTSSQLSALGVLFNHGDLLMGALADLELVRPPSMTRVVNALEEKGLVARRQHPDDGRQFLVALTDAGREVVRANRRRRDAWLAVRLAELDDDERDLVRRALPVLEKVNHA